MPLSFADLFQRARGGDAVALGELLENYRAYLRILAQRGLDQRLQVRVDASDVVQQTFLEAQRDIQRFRGESEPELIGWLRTILEHNVHETRQRHLGAQKRSLARERSMDDTGGEGIPLRNRLSSEQSSPSQRVMRGEAAVRLARALEGLPHDQREAVRLRHLEGCNLKEIAAAMERSELAVAGLLKRGLKKLREHFC